MNKDHPHNSNEENKSPEKPLTSISKPDSSDNSAPTFNFMTEIFHITLRAMNIGYFPSVVQYEKLMRVIDQVLKLEPGSKEAQSSPQVSFTNLISKSLIHPK